MIRSVTRLWLPLVVSVIWVFLATALMLLFNRYLLMSLPLGLRMVLMILTYWALAAVPLIFAVRDRYRPFPAEKLGLQLLWGLGIGAALSAVCTLLPHLLGWGHLVGGGQTYYTQLWQFAYQLVYYVAAVGLVEEFIFRGFLFHRLRLLFRSEWAAILISSALFGLFHFGSGDVLQMLSTGLLGGVFCLCRKKLRHCTLLSLIIAHGIYDWMIIVWAFLL